MIDESVQALYRQIEGHEGMASINGFNHDLLQRPLNQEERGVFLASLRAFNRWIPAGILSLASRLSDEYMLAHPFDAYDLASPVLEPAVDEYGLSGNVRRSHFRLFSDFASHLGVNETELEDHKNQVLNSIVLGEFLRHWYRYYPTGFGLGVHAASEATSMLEFTGWHPAFLKFREYGFHEGHPALNYVAVHTTLEEDHTKGAKIGIENFLRDGGSIGTMEQIQSGALGYMEMYAAMFNQLRQRIFGTRA